jgi:hypothetical protein
MTKRVYDGKIMRNLALNANLSSPMRSLLIYLVAVSHNKAYTYAANKTILKQTGIGKERYFRIMEQLRNLGIAHGLMVKWGRTIGSVIFINKGHVLLRARKGQLTPQLFRIDRKDAVAGVLALMEYRQKAPKSGIRFNRYTKRKIVATCLRTLRRRGVV